MGSSPTAPSPPPGAHPVTAEKSHLEKGGMSFTTEAQCAHRHLTLDPSPDPHVSSERVWPNYGPTPDLSKRFQGHKERGSEKQDWLACAG
ncbi:hypothetical protein Taro_005354 [Colocasia esculenta]|uniref:Uncharacterized protein n=1 Tax=Colocasia esculenta TaxID=4460 RepID=A0A843TUB3_COLES|nr:hypothetical protein [Colocasia esculenta]